MFNPQQMQKMMRQLGIKSKELDVEEVIFKTSTGDVRLIKPQVVEMDMQGNKTWQISGGEVVEKNYTDEDVDMVMDQAGVSREDAEKALVETKGDVAEAILKFKEDI